MISKVLEFVKQHNMLSLKDKVLLGISGGADSVCLLEMMLALQSQYQLSLVAVHVNHQYRGEESDGDEAFVEALCKAREVEYVSKRVDMEQYARSNGCSLEEAGRHLRYASFFEVYNKLGCNKIAVAHNKNDLAETVLLNLVRGTGIRGLSGIEPVRDQIIRPIMCLTREEIEAFLKQYEWDYRVDSTNLEEIFTRNRVRHSVLPVLRSINSQAVSHIERTAFQLREIENYLQYETLQSYQMVVSEKDGQYFLKKDNLASYHDVIVKRVFRYVLGLIAGGLKDIEEKHINDMELLLSRNVGREIHLPHNIIVVRTYDGIAVKLRSECKIVSFYIEICEPGEYSILEGNAKLRVSFLNYKKSMSIPKNRCTKWFDYDKIKNTIVVRSRQQGDYLVVNEAGNRKSLKNLMIDLKIPRQKREVYPLLCDGNHVMWLIGDRISEAYKVNENTTKILVVEYMEV